MPARHSIARDRLDSDSVLSNYFEKNLSSFVLASKGESRLELSARWQYVTGDVIDHDIVIEEGTPFDDIPVQPQPSPEHVLPQKSAPSVCTVIA